MGIDDILEAVITRMPPPVAILMRRLRAMIVDSWFDNYVGVVMLVRVVDGTLIKGERIKHDGHRRGLRRRQPGCVHAQVGAARSLQCRRGRLHHGGHQGTAGGQGRRHHHAGEEAAQQPGPGQRGAAWASRKSSRRCSQGCTRPRPANTTSLRDALEKLKLNDSSLRYEPEVSQALGFGFRCGFLGLLHMEIVQERLEREFDQDLITTAPSVVYEVVLGNGDVIQVDNPSKMPDLGRMLEIREPIVTVHLYMPQDYVGPVMTLANQKRGQQMNMAYHGRQVMLTYEMPLAKIVLDFFDKLKSVSRGYASMDYEFKEYRAADVVKVDILLNGDKVDALSIIVHRSQSQYRRPRGGGQDARVHFTPDVRRGHPGRHRGQHHCARDNQGAPQRTCSQNATAATSAQTQAARKAESRQEAHEADRLGGGAPRSIPGHFQVED
jgi:GTP-binding protein LepA